MGRILQLFRRTFSGCLFLLLLLYVGGAVSKIFGFDPSLAGQIQLVPALLSGSFGILLSLFLFTLFFGRWYCSFLCPLGILQDLLARFRKMKGGNIGKTSTILVSILKLGVLSKVEARLRILPQAYVRYSEDKILNRNAEIGQNDSFRTETILRYTILFLCLISFYYGATLILLLVDPWSVFGRITTTFVLPVLTFANNLLAALFNHFGIYGIVAKEYILTRLSVFLIASVSLSLLGYFVFFYGQRFWCNSVCPVGTVLSVVAKKPLLRVHIDLEKCVSCGLCEKHCKTGVIVLETKQVTSSNCVACFNCLPVCQYDAISYGLPIKGKSR